MADLSRLKKSSSLGAPPKPEEASSNLSAPEHGPAAPEQPAAAVIEVAKTPVPRRVASSPAPTPVPRIDGRTLRRSSRTVTLATRVTPEFDTAIRQIAQTRGVMIVEVLEEALAAYQAQISNN